MKTHRNGRHESWKKYKQDDIVRACYWRSQNIVRLGFAPKLNEVGFFLCWKIQYLSATKSRCSYLLFLIFRLKPQFPSRLWFIHKQHFEDCSSLNNFVFLLLTKLSCYGPMLGDVLLLTECVISVFLTNPRNRKIIHTCGIVMREKTSNCVVLSTTLSVCGYLASAQAGVEQLCVRMDLSDADNW